MPHAVLFKPKSAYLIKYGKPFPIHPPLSHGISLKPNYVTPAHVHPQLKPTLSPNSTPLPRPEFSSTHISAPFPIFPHEQHKYPPLTSPSITTVVPGPTLFPFSYSSTTVSPKPSPHPIHPTLGPVVFPQPHIIPKSQHNPSPHPPTITTTHPKISHFFPPITTTNPKHSPRLVITTLKPDFFPHHPPTLAASHHKLPSFLPTLTTTPEPFPHSTTATFKPELIPHPHVGATSHFKIPLHHPALTTTHPNSSPFFPPSHSSVVPSQGPTHFRHPPHLIKVSPKPPSRPSLIATSLPKFSPRYPFLTTHNPKITPHPSVITSLGSPLFPHPHLVTSPQPTPFPPPFITTSTPRPHILPFHSNHHKHHHPEDHNLHHPFFGVSTGPSVTTTTSIVTSLSEPKPPFTHLTSDTERPRRLTITTINKEHKPTLKPKPIFIPTELSSASLYSKNHKSIFVTTLPESEEERQKDYRFPKTSDVLQESILANVEPSNLYPSGIVSTPATYTSNESLNYHTMGHEESVRTPAPPAHTPNPPTFSKVSDVRLTTIPNDIKTHDSLYETPFSPSVPISIDHTPKRPPLAYEKPLVQSQPLPPSYNADLHKYSIDIKVKPRPPPAFPSHGTLFRTSSSPPSSPINTPVPHRQTHFHSHLDRKFGYHHPRDSISFAPTSFDPYSREDPYLKSFLPHSDILISSWSHVPQTHSSINNKPVHAPFFDPHTKADSTEQMENQSQLESWKPLAGPTSFPSAFYTPSPSSSVKRASSPSYQH